MFSCLLPSMAFVTTSSQLFQEVNICISCLLKTKFRQPPSLSSFSTSLLLAPSVKFTAVTLIMSRYNALLPQVNLIRHKFFPGISAASAHYHSSHLTVADMVQSWQPQSFQSPQGPRGTLCHTESFAEGPLPSRQMWKRLSSLPLAAFCYLAPTLLCHSLLQYFWKNSCLRLDFRTHVLQAKSGGLNLNSEFITRKSCNHKDNTTFRVVRSSGLSAPST